MFTTQKYIYVSNPAHNYSKVSEHESWKISTQSRRHTQIKVLKRYRTVCSNITVILDKKKFRATSFTVKAHRFFILIFGDKVYRCGGADYFQSKIFNGGKIFVSHSICPSLCLVSLASSGIPHCSQLYEIFGSVYRAKKCATLFVWWDCETGGEILIFILICEMYVSVIRLLF